mgnify:CR=1 FL=1
MQITQIANIFIYPLLLTIIIEGIIIILITRKKKWLVYNIICNLLTNPLLNLSLLYLVTNNNSFLIPFIIGEILVIIVEWLIYILISNDKKADCFKYSLITNMISLTIGLLLNLI